jgi:hypothetical protein
VGLCSSPVTTTCTRGCCGVPSAGATPRYRVVGREELDLARSWLTTFQASQAFCFWKKKKILHCHATGLTDESKQLSADDHRALHEALEQQRGREASYDMSQLRTRSRGQLHVITNSTVISQLYLATQNKNSLLISASAQLYSPHNSTRHTKHKALCLSLVHAPGAHLLLRRLVHALALRLGHAVALVVARHHAVHHRHLVEHVLRRLSVATRHASGTLCTDSQNSKRRRLVPGLFNVLLGVRRVRTFSTRRGAVAEIT